MIHYLLTKCRGDKPPPDGIPLRLDSLMHKAKIKGVNIYICKNHKDLLRINLTILLWKELVLFRESRTSAKLR